MGKFLTYIFAIIILLGSMVMIGLLGIGQFSGGDGFFRSCRYNQETQEKECFWFWEKNRVDLSKYNDF
ncbi:hypothetical protein JXA63_04975 [Candidatus Woesebacteria bacterium]|nr:hypothetical protein [Candidatus Woesebacteria bacterium]